MLYSYARYKKAYDDYTMINTEDRDSSNAFEELLEDENERSDMALYWSMLVRFQLLFLTFLRSIRERNWNLNVACHL